MFQTIRRYRVRDESRKRRDTSTVLPTLKKWLQKPIGATAECQILKQLYIINLLSFIPIIIYTISPSITNSLGTVVAQPLLHSTVPHGSRSSIAEPIVKNQCLSGTFPVISRHAGLMGSARCKLVCSFPS